MHALLEMSETFKHLTHPFGDLWLLRWAAFALVIAAVVFMPLLFRKRISRTRDGVSTYEARKTKAWIPLGAILLLSALAIVVVPYLPFVYPEESGSPIKALEWKTLNPFDTENNSSRMILIFLILPLVVGLPLLQYFFIRRQLSGPARLMMAGLRMVVIWLIVVMLCAPYTSITPEHQEPWRSAIVIDASESMNHRAEPLSPFVVLDYGELFKENTELQDALATDARETQALLDYLNNSLRLPGLPKEPTRFSFSTLSPELWEMRRMARKVVRHRSTRLLSKLELLRGQRPNLETLKTSYAELETQREELSKARASLQKLRAGFNREATILKENAVTRLESDIRLAEKAVEKELIAGPLFEALATMRSKVSADSAEAKRLEALKPRLREAISRVADNLNSTIHIKGPTRWDIATELVMPGMGPSRDSEATGRPIPLGEDKLALIDALRRHDSAQGMRLPEDIAEIAISASATNGAYRQVLADLRAKDVIPDEVEALSARHFGKDLVSTYLFSAPDFGSASTRAYRQVALEELDFLKADGSMTKLHAAYGDVVAKESSGDLANLFIFSDGIDTSSDVTEHAKAAHEARWALDNSGKQTRIHSVLVGFSSQGKLLRAAEFKGPKIARRDEVVTLELTIEANQPWKDVEIFLKNMRDYGNPTDVPYTLLNNVPGVSTVDVRATRQDEGTFLNFVEISFTPEVDDDDPFMVIDEDGNKSWSFPLQVRLNEEAMPGEMTYDNNIIDLERPLIVTDKKIRVLVIDQRFRYETRYLVEALARDKAFEMQSFIIDADREWPQRSSNYSPEARRRMPPLVNPFCRVINRGKSDAKTTTATSFEDWNENQYDCVIIGDVHPVTLLEKYRNWLKNYVREHSGGLIFLAGQYNMPWAYSAGPLAEMIPVKIPSNRDSARVDTTRERFLGVTPIGQSSDILALSVNQERQKELWGYSDNEGNFKRGQLDGFFWYAKTEGVKDPSCVVFARVAELGEKLIFSASEGVPSTPLVVGRKESNGRVLYFGSDELWRMRRYFGDFYTYRVWQNSIRWAAAPHLNRDDSSSDEIDIFTDQERYNLGDEVTAFCEVVGGESVMDQIHRAQTQARQSLGISNTTTDVPILLNWSVDTKDGSQRSGILVVNDPLKNRRFQGVFKPTLPGEYTLSLINDTAEDRKPYLFKVEASTEAKREASRTPEVSPEAMLLLASIRDGAGSAGEEGDGESDKEEKAEERWYAHFGEVDQLITVNADTVVHEGSEIFQAWNLLQLLIVIASMLAIEWFARKLVRLA